MTFNSIEFLILFPTLLLGFYAMPHRLRWSLLLVGSLIFYVWLIPSYLFVASYIVLSSYALALFIKRAKPSTKKHWLFVSVVLSLIPLFTFKYFNFVNENLATFSEVIGWNYSQASLKLILPLGISFQTFQALSYLIEVYQERIEPELHLGIYSLYILFFPQLVAGPIERPQNLLPQFRKEAFFEPAHFNNGLRLMLWGFFKKVVIADRMASLPNEIFVNPSEFSTIYLLPATLCFAIQIYCDFSGYSDIARGIGQTFGIQLMKNFEQPYLARNPVDFWRRWHISLSTWFRDYLYFPLGGNRSSRLTHFRNLFIVFVVSGLWHGANWTFVVWGAFHGMGIILYLIYSQSGAQKYFPVFSRPWVGTALTFSMVTVGWVFFRANSVSEALYVLTHLFDFSTIGTEPVWGKSTLMISLAGLIVLFIGDYLIEKKLEPKFFELAVPVRWGVYWATALCIMNLGTVENVAFIYFQF